MTKHHRPLNLAQTTLVRRVVARSSTQLKTQCVEHVCGICRTSYMSLADASACLQSCWNNIQSSETFVAPVFKKNQVGKTVYRFAYKCRLCGRSYASIKMAHGCVADCRSRLGLVFVADLDPNAVQSFLDKRKVVPIRPAQQTALHASPEPVIESSPVAEADFAAPAPAPVASAAEQIVHPKKDASKKWFRDNARYACNVCQARYFTRIEVEACWDAHPGEIIG